MVQRYRQVLRHIWNSCIWVDPKLRTWDSVYSFRDLKLPLFRALVADPLDIQANDHIFGAGFEIAPNAADGIPVLRINSRAPSEPDEGIWEMMTGPFKANDVRLRLIDLFDWNPLGYIDLRYYVVMIEALNKQPDRVGQHALVDTAEAAVFWNDQAPSS